MCLSLRDEEWRERKLEAKRLDRNCLQLCRKLAFDRDDIAREALALVRERFEGRVGCDDVWVIGDTPLDVRCARAIGARCVGVTTGLYRRDQLIAAAPDLLLDSLTDAAGAWSVCLSCS